MASKQTVEIEKLKKDFSFLNGKIKNKEVLAVLLYGSYASGKQHIKSDIDICIVSPESKTIKNQTKLLRYLWRNANANKYDIRIFEEFPLYIKASVIKNYKLILGNKKELEEYFYFTNKIWKDQSINWLEKQTIK